MNTRLIFSLFMIALCLIHFDTSHAQNADDPTTYIHIENPPQAQWQHQLIADLSVLIHANDFENNEQYPQFALRHLHNRTIVTVTPANSPSPLVDLRLNIAFYANDAPEKLRAIIDYSFGHCETPQPNLSHFSLYTSALLQLNCAIMINAYERAIFIYESLGLAPSNNLQFNLAWVYLQAGQPESTFALMDRLIQAATSTNRVSALTHRAQLHALNFDYDNAIADMDSAIAQDTQNPALYVLRGQMVLLLYEWDRVEENYNSALAITPDYAPAYYFRGILRYSLLERESALADFERYLELAPNGQYVNDANANAEAIRAELSALAGD